MKLKNTAITLILIGVTALVLSGSSYLWNRGGASSPSVDSTVEVTSTSSTNGSSSKSELRWNRGGTPSNKTVDTEISRCITTLVWAVSKPHGHRSSASVDRQFGDVRIYVDSSKVKGIDNLIDAHCSEYLDEELITAFESGLIDASPTSEPHQPLIEGTPDFTGGLGSSNETP